jgi:methionine-rich copper-binding protein CopC
MTLRHTIILSAACAALSISVGTAAFAHAHLVRATPADGATLKTPPSEVTLKFNERLEPSFTSAIIRDAEPLGRAVG